MTLEVTLDDARLTRLIEQMPGEADRIVRETAFLVEAEAKQQAPVDTGNLRASIQTLIESVLVAIVSVGAEYGYWVEHGARGAEPQPFMSPAVEAGRRHLQKRLDAWLKGNE